MGAGKRGTAGQGKGQYGRPQAASVRGASHDESGGFGFLGFAGDFLAVESRGFPEVDHQMARHKFSAATRPRGSTG